MRQLVLAGKKMVCSNEILWKSLIKGLFIKLWAEMKETTREPQVGGSQSAPDSSWVLGWEREPGEWIAWTLFSLPSVSAIVSYWLIPPERQKTKDPLIQPMQVTTPGREQVENGEIKLSLMVSFSHDSPLCHFQFSEKQWATILPHWRDSGLFVYMFISPTRL